MLLAPFPNMSNGEMDLVKHYLFEQGTSNPRGTSPGAYAITQYVGSMIPTLYKMQGGGVAAGKTLMAITSGQGCMMFDITGPWR